MKNRVARKKIGRFIGVIAALALSAALSSCGGGGGGGGNTPPSGTRHWTYMVYMGADNNLSNAGLSDLNEMETVGSSPGVAVVVQAEFSTRYTQGMPTSETGRIYVENDHDPSQPNLSGSNSFSIGNVNMASPAALTDFITWAKATYPAEHYALVIWDHGSGWKDRLRSPSAALLRGAVQDETSGTFMTLPDLAKGVADSGVHFDVVNFDACLMAMYEVAYQFRGLADYMVFSEETEPGEGDPYDTILASLAGDPSMTGQVLAGTIVDRFNQFYTVNNRGATTKSAVNMSGLATLDANLLGLVAALSADGAAPVVMTSAATGATTQSFAYPANHDLWDLCNYLETSAAGSGVRTAAAAVKSALSSMVIDSRTTGADAAGAHGLSIYLPLASETSSAELADYALLACNQARAAAGGTWGSYINTLVGAGGGTATYGTGNFGLYLFWTDLNDQACDADLDLYVYEPDGNLYAPWMGQTSPNGFFSADSSASGKQEEYYLANDQVQAGDYFFLVNMYSAGTCTQAKAHLFYYDPVNLGDSNWHEVNLAGLGLSLSYPSPVLLDLSAPWSGQTLGTLGDLNSYSDWWVPFLTTRTAAGMHFFTGSALPAPTKNVQLILRYKKGSRFFGIGK